MFFLFLKIYQFFMLITIVSYFTNIFATPSVVTTNDLPASFIPCLLKDEDNLKLTSLVTLRTQSFL
jgi:hypothetical protein